MGKGNKESEAQRYLGQPAWWAPSLFPFYGKEVEARKWHRGDLNRSSVQREADAHAREKTGERIPTQEPPHHRLQLTTDTPNIPGSPHTQPSSRDCRVCAKHPQGGRGGKGLPGPAHGATGAFPRDTALPPRQPQSASPPLHSLQQSPFPILHMPCSQTRGTDRLRFEPKDPASPPIKTQGRLLCPEGEAARPSGGEHSHLFIPRTLQLCNPGTGIWGKAGEQEG